MDEPRAVAHTKTPRQGEVQVWMPFWCAVLRGKRAKADQETGGKVLSQSLQLKSHSCRSLSGIAKPAFVSKHGSARPTKSKPSGEKRDTPGKYGQNVPRLRLFRGRTSSASTSPYPDFNPLCILGFSPMQKPFKKMSLGSKAPPMSFT